MIPRYHVEYAIKFGHRLHPQSYTTDDPVACEEFLQALLEHGLRIKSILHEGVDLPAAEFDRLVKNAAATMAARHVAESLNIDAEQVHFRFGFAA